MKNILSFAVIAMIGLLVFSGCKKKSSAPTYGMTASIDGVAVSMPNCYDQGSDPDSYTFAGHGNTTSTPSISLIIKKDPSGSYLTTGTYDIDSVNNNAAYLPAGSTTILKAESGSIIITAVTPGVSVIGTFSFVCKNGTVISSGSFTAEP